MGTKPVFSFRQMLGHAVRSLCLNSRKDYLFLLVCSQSFLQMIDFCSFPKLGGSAGVVISSLLLVWPNHRQLDATGVERYRRIKALHW